MQLGKMLVNLGEGATLARDVGKSGNLSALASMPGARVPRSRLAARQARTRGDFLSASVS
jgi:hypothetical protein